MKVRKALRITGAAAASILIAGCATRDMAKKDALNEPSDRLAALEDRLPPNPNRPPDSRQHKAIPVVVQHDPALNPEPDQREDKGLAVNAGADQLVRAQDPTLTQNAPNPAGGPAAQAQVETATLADSDLAARVKDAITALKLNDSNVVPATPDPTTGEGKGGNFEVTAKNGVVTLSGAVESETGRTAIEQAVSRVHGVNSVNNYLTVTKPRQQ